MIRERIESVRHVGPSKASLVVLAVQFALSFGFCSGEKTKPNQKNPQLFQTTNIIFIYNSVQ